MFSFFLAKRGDLITAQILLVIVIFFFIFDVPKTVLNLEELVALAPLYWRNYKSTFFGRLEKNDDDIVLPICYSPPFWAHVRYIFELKTDEKNDMILDAFVDWIWVVFWLMFSIILERFWIDFDLFREFAKTRKNRTALEREHQNQGFGELDLAPKSKKNASNFASKF